MYHMAINSCIARAESASWNTAMTEAILCAISQVVFTANVPVDAIEYLLRNGDPQFVPVR
jgi:hypothetical protein